MKNTAPFVLGIFLLLMTFHASATTRYVDLNCANATPPFTDWSIAATNIQDAIDVAVDGDFVLVTNGVYGTGGRMWFDSGTNRVTINNSLVLQSLNGPGVTTIKGAHGSGTNAARCVMLASSNAVLSGFTLTNGQSGVGNFPNGGGVFCSPSSVVSNCVLVGNLANYDGGGAYRGTLLNCLITGNSSAADAGGGGVYNATVINSILSLNTAQNSGGGAYGSTLVNCVISNNSARNGGGAYSGTMTNCLVVGNSATIEGGGAWTGNADRIYNCTIVSNTASASGGVREGICVNSIIYFNNAASFPNGHPLSVVDCCMTPLQSGIGNFTNEPLFVNPSSGNFRLRTNSPCINAGKNQAVATIIDLDANPRIIGGTVDIGAFEFQSPSSVLSYAWAQQNGLPTDGSADFEDPDADGLNNYSEWIAGTIPTNAASVLSLNSPSANVSGLNVSWQSVSGKTYYLQRSTNLLAQPGFTFCQSNLVGVVGTTTFSDTTATNGGPYFYRVGVQ